MADNYTKLLEDKSELLNKMLKLTRDFAASNVDDEEKAEAYTVLLDNREALFDQIKSIDSKLAASSYQTGEKGSHNMELKIKETIRLFLEADKKATEIVKAINAELAKNIKSINNGKAVNQLYQNISRLNTTRFDKSN